jgi:hypothetical protein
MQVRPHGGTVLALTHHVNNLRVSRPAQELAEPIITERRVGESAFQSSRHLGHEVAYLPDCVAVKLATAFRSEWPLFGNQEPAYRAVLTIDADGTPGHRNTQPIRLLFQLGHRLPPLVPMLP